MEYLKELSSKFDQSKLLKNFEFLDKNEKNEYINEVKKIAFDQIWKISNSIKIQDIKKLENIKNTDLIIYKNKIKEDKKKLLKNLGKEAILKKKCGIVILASGQATRLKFFKSKALFKPGLKSNRNILEMIINKVYKLERKLNFNKEELINIFILVNSFDYDEVNLFIKEKIKRKNIFLIKEEHNMPLLDLNKQIVFNNYNQVKYYPQGNGTCYLNLFKDEIYNNLIKDKVDYLNFISVDNILVKPLKPINLGHLIHNKLNICHKFVKKVKPSEKVGVFGLINNNYECIEYYNLGEEEQNKKDEQGNLLFNMANILNFIIDTRVGKEIYNNIDIKYHEIKKSLPYYDFEKKKLNIENNINSYKYEFILNDIFPLFNKQGFVEVLRFKEFSPIKNSNDTNFDNSKIAIEYLKNYNLEWAIKKFDLKAYKGKFVEFDFYSLIGKSNEYIRNLILSNNDDYLLIK